MSLKELAVGASGIYLAYLTSSLLSQRLYSDRYASILEPGKQSKFQYPGLLVWFSSLLCAIFGWAKGRIQNERPNPIPKRQQIILGILYTLNILFATTSLLYISYLHQVLIRNLRYLAVVLVGIFFSRVKKGSSLKLPLKKVAVALVITAGVLLFSILGQKQKKNKNIDPSTQWIGYLAIGISTLADAFFSDSQAYAKVMFKPTANHLFTSANFLTFVFVFLISLFKGEGIEQIKFCIEHPSVFVDIFAISILQVIGQVSIYYVVANFKQHIFPLISTTRKVFTVLLSILFFGHHVNPYQWLSVTMVFGGLAYELMEQINAKKGHHQNQNQNQKKIDTHHQNNVNQNKSQESMKKQ